MGREIRGVPPGWEHPEDQEGHYIPMFDRTYPEALEDWLQQHRQWENGEHPDQQKYRVARDYRFYAQWGGDAPCCESYRPEYLEEPIWHQLYETVSEGTPLSPPFATQDELIAYLVNVGDFNGEQWSAEAAEKFVKGSGSLPSGLIRHGQMIDLTKTPL